VAPAGRHTERGRVEVGFTCSLLLVLALVVAVSALRGQTPADWPGWLQALGALAGLALLAAGWRFEEATRWPNASFDPSAVDPAPPASGPEGEAERPDRGDALGVKD